MSTSSKNRSYLSLRELHLSPHYIYMVDQPDRPGLRCCLEMWKADQKIGETNQIHYSSVTQQRRFPALQFGKVRFVFDVEALFQEDAQAKIKLKLRSLGDDGTELEEFQVHILYYSYEFSKEKVMRYRQNSIGRRKNYILNYSFSAIYGQPIESLLFRKHELDEESQLTQLTLHKKDSKYGIVIKESTSTDPFNTLLLIGAVADKGYGDHRENAKNEILQRSSEDSAKSQARHASRSIVMIDQPPLGEEESNLSQPELVAKEKMRLQNIGQWLLIFLCSLLIVLLMHPNRKT